jgi:hypothetical protein
MTRALDGMSNLQTDSVDKRHSTGRPRRSDEDVDRVWQAFILGPKKAYPEQVHSYNATKTVHKILLKILCLKLYKCQAVKKRTAHDQ